MMRHYTKTLPERAIEISDRFGRPVISTLPAITYKVYPTLAVVSQWLFQDYGPLQVNWRDGALCPFNDRVSRSNIRCVSGNRGPRRCAGIGLELWKHTDHMTDREKRRLTGRIHCYAWEHRFIDFINDLGWSQFFDWPDDPWKLSIHVVLRMIRETGWVAWRRELQARKDKRKRDWLKALKPHTRISQRTS